ncbi:MAG: exonuclease domain-containing protein [Clostridia bacterium]|nr:exonuclease domain-containing protein [Clostridia bacterium]
MNYIILDMEWDSAYCPRISRFINQIIQIGAVKLNESFEIVDTFEKTVRSSFSKKVSGRFTALTGITTKDMLSGIPLENAVTLYNEWAGTDTVTMTWSNSDLFSIIENEKNLMRGVKFHIEKYLDLQSYIQNEMRVLGFEITSQIALGKAAEMLGITTDNLELHTAKDDSLVCAALLKNHYCESRFNELIKDTQNPEFYKRLLFKPTYLSDIRSREIDRRKLRFKCDVCGSDTKRLGKWNYRNHWFSANFSCKSCDRKFSGRVSFKKLYDNVVVKKRICEIKVAQKSNEVNDEVQSVPEKV